MPLCPFTTDPGTPRCTLNSSEPTAAALRSPLCQVGSFGPAAKLPGRREAAHQTQATITNSANRRSGACRWAAAKPLDQVSTSHTAAAAAKAAAAIRRMRWSDADPSRVFTANSSVSGDRTAAPAAATANSQSADRRQHRPILASKHAFALILAAENQPESPRRSKSSPLARHAIYTRWFARRTARVPAASTVSKFACPR